MATTTTNHVHPTTAPISPDGRPGGPVPTVIETTGLQCRYGRFVAVHELDLRVARGELFALLGTNGAGKTTTLETLEGHRRADGGAVRVLGVDPRANRRAIAPRVGVMLQASGLPDDLTVREAVQLTARLHPSATTTRPPGEILARVGLEHRARVRTRSLSGGERRRLDLAMALVTDPELLFLDEPTTGMDPEARARTWELIRDLRRRGTTIVLTTHYLEEAEDLADRIAIMHAGRIVAEGTRAELIREHPATIRCQLPTAVDPSTLPSFSATPRRTPHADGWTFELPTRALQDDLTVLLTWARQHDVVLGELRATEPSLGTVFHALVDDPTEA